jgi:energy-coupling factor transport system ATP-binding protein
MPVILENIICRAQKRKTPGHGKILNIPSLRIDGGELVGIIDSSAEESAALGKIICGLVAPDAGSVSITEADGQKAIAVFFDSEAEKALSENTVEKEVCALLRKTEKDKEKLSEKAKNALEMVGLDYDAVRHRSPFELTPGERRAAALASLLALSPSLIVLDNPTDNMDGIWRARLMELLKKLSDGGAAVVMFTADTSLLSEYASRVIIVKDGCIAIDSSAKNVFSEYFILNHLGVAVPDVTKCCRMLKENGMDMPNNIILYEQFLDRLKILMWRKNK